MSFKTKMRVDESTKSPTIDVLEAMRHLESFAAIGPRPTCGEKEKEAALFAKGKMEAMGLETQEDRFECNPSMFRNHIVVFLFVVAMGALPLFLTPLHIGFFLAALGCFYARKFYINLIHNKPTPFSRILPQKPCRNIIGKVSPKGKKKNRIVFLSHLDSALCSPIFSEKMVRSLKSNIKIDLILFMVLAVLYLISGVTGNLYPYYGAIALSLYVVGSLLVLLYSELFSPISPGVNDNGSGVAAVLTLAEKFKKESLENTEIWFVCLGAEEPGTYGSKDLLANHAQELKESYIINIDSVAVGHPRYLVDEGFSEEYFCDPEMVAILDKLSQERPDLNLKSFHFKGWGGYTDCTHLIQNGCKAISFASTEEDGLIKNWHTLNDTLDGIQKDTYQKVMDSVYHLALQLDRKFD